ncbi:MAG: tetratricopeptide repeat protein [Caulobacteraceae bacterium]
MFAEIERGVTLLYVQRLGEAQAAFEAALALRPGDPHARAHLALAHLAAGRFDQGWPLYEDRWNSVMKEGLATLPRPLWSAGASLAGRTVLLKAEQGLGDTLQFVRFAPLLAARGSRVLLAVQPELVELCRSVAGVADVVRDDGPLPHFDLCIPLMSLPFALGLTDIPVQAPYLSAPPAKTAAWAARLGPRSGKRVGLAWSGGLRPGVPEFWATNTRRNIALARLAPIAGAPVSYYSLQKGAQAEAELHALRAAGWDGPRILDLPGDLDGFDDTAAVIENLDLVVTVDTSVAHLAGALGKPVWILNRYDGCWRWMLDRDDSPWYPTARIFRQESFDDWDPVVAALASALTEFAET